MKLLLIIAMATAAYLTGDSGVSGIERFALLGVVINQNLIASAYKSFNTIFQESYAAAESILEKMAVVVPSTTRQEEYKWLGNSPGMREWIGERAIKDISVEGFVIKNRDFEATISVDRNDMEDDTISIYEPLFRQLAESAKQHPDELILDLIKNGFSSACYDGKNFFDTAHPNGEQADWSNSSTSALDQTAYESARTSMMSLVNEEGKPMRVKPSLLIVPPQLEATANSILRADRSANGSSNIWFKSADVHVAHELASMPTYWFLADTNRAAKPLIFQKRRAPELVALDSQANENVFHTKEFVYGVDYRGNAGYGLPHLIYGSTGGA